MFHLFQQLDRVFDHRFRLGIALYIQINDEASFSELKQELMMTDGNLASHLKVMEESEYLAVRKKFEDKKPKTTYYLTLKGREACREHLGKLKIILKHVQR